MDEAIGHKIYNAIDEAFQNFTEELGGEDGIAIVLQGQWDGEFPVTAIAEIYDFVEREEPDEYEFEISFVKRVNHGK